MFPGSISALKWRNMGKI